MLYVILHSSQDIYKNLDLTMVQLIDSMISIIYELWQFRGFQSRRRAAAYC
jgi:hypothetical protein